MLSKYNLRLREKPAKELPNVLFINVYKKLKINRQKCLLSDACWKHSLRLLKIMDIPRSKL